MTDKRASVFLTETNVHLDDYPTDELANLEAIVSGVSQMSQSTMLLKKRKEMREVDDALDFMKEEFSQRIEACDERRREFTRKQQEMREQVTRFEKFIHENDSKRQRAEVKAKAERKSYEQMEIKKKQLMSELEKDEKLRDELYAKLAILSKFRAYLEETVEASEAEYDEIGDILNRYNTLGDANIDLKKQVGIAELEIDDMRQKLRMCKIETQNQILVQNSAINHDQQALEKIRVATLQQHLDREQADKIANNRTRISGQVIMSIKNLHQRCAQSSRSSRGRHSNGSLKDSTTADGSQGNSVLDQMHEMLKVIAERIRDLDFVRSNYQEFLTKKDQEHPKTTAVVLTSPLVALEAEPSSTGSSVTNSSVGLNHSKGLS